MPRCSRCEKDDLYRNYHDHERWVPVHDDRTHFEFLLLESFQAGLSRYTVLKKREGFRDAFDGFDPEKIARYDEAKILALLWNSGIIRHRDKIQAAIHNAQLFIDIQKSQGSRDAYIWSYVWWVTIYNQFTDLSQVPATTPLSDQISKDLKKMGMKFVWSTTIYAYMQAIGMVDDHVEGCWRYRKS